MLLKQISELFHTIDFSLLIIFYSFSKFFANLSRFILLRPLILISKLFSLLSSMINHRKDGSISNLDLIDLALRNMHTKKTRTYVTVGGMTIGIATIVFLVSVGYGLQQLVISRVASLEEMKQTEVTTQTGSKLKINDKTINEFKDITGVESVYPLIAVVAKLNYNKSVTDIAAYGVTTNYLTHSAIKISKGELFDNNDISSFDSVQNEQKTVIAKMGQEVSKVKYSIENGELLMG